MLDFAKSMSLVSLSVVVVILILSIAGIVFTENEGRAPKEPSGLVALYADGTYKRNPGQADLTDEPVDPLVLDMARFWTESLPQKNVSFSGGGLIDHLSIQMTELEFRELEASLDHLAQGPDDRSAPANGQFKPADVEYWAGSPMQYVNFGISLNPSQTEELRDRHFLMNAFYLPKDYRSLVNCTAEPGPWPNSTVIRISPEYLKNHPYTRGISGVTCFAPGFPAKSYAIVSKDTQGKISSVTLCRVKEYPSKEDIRSNTCQSSFRWRSIWNLSLITHEKNVGRLPYLIETVRAVFDEFESRARTKLPSPQD